MNALFKSTMISFMSDFEHINSDLKERAINEYKAALKMPRKKKKVAKKSALLLYSIACILKTY